MIQNFILLIIALVLLALIALLWLRQSLLHILHEISQQQRLLQKDLDKRRDILPYLLESARQAEPPSDKWRKLVEDHSFFHSQNALSKEWEFQETLNTYLHETPLKSVAFLDAKKDIQGLSALVEQEKKKLTRGIEHYNQRRKEFPFSLAAALFDLKELSL